jgi:hypothetical protein
MLLMSVAASSFRASAHIRRFDMSLTLSPGGHPPLSEIALQEKLVDILKSDPATRKTVQIFRSKKEVGTLNGLLGEWKFDKDFGVTKEPVLRETLPPGRDVARRRHESLDHDESTPMSVILIESSHNCLQPSEAP